MTYCCLSGIYVHSSTVLSILMGNYPRFKISETIIAGPYFFHFERRGIVSWLGADISYLTVY